MFQKQQKMEVHIETAVRICPIPPNSTDMICIQSDPINNIVQLANAQSYPVNYALPMNCCQNTVFVTTIVPLVHDMLEGCNISVVTLGQSGTGKSYTLLGPGFHCASSESEYGIIPRFIREVFTKMESFRDRQWSIHITWMQICGESVQDLLGVGSIQCASICDVFQLIQQGMSNITHKRAHTLFTMSLEQEWVVDKIVHRQVSSATFTDLAGSEKVSVVNSNGVMQTIPTDFGLQSLQNCIMSLSEACNMQYNNYNFVPYNKSVLTTLLKDSFGGRAKTLLLCCVSPFLQDFSETLYTLQLALRAQMIKNFVIFNTFSTVESFQGNYGIFEAKFAFPLLSKLVSNAEELFQRFTSNKLLPEGEIQQVSQWLVLKQECEECLSENSEPRRSLERIEEEIECSTISDVESTKEREEAPDTNLLSDFHEITNKLVIKANMTDITRPSTKETVSNPNTEYHMKGARGRRGSIHSPKELNPDLAVATSRVAETEECTVPEKNPLLTYETKKRNLNQIITELQLCQKEIAALEKTIQVKENLMQSLLKYKDTKSSTHQRVELKCYSLQKECEKIKNKLVQAQLEKKHNSEHKYKNELTQLETKLRDTEFMKTITEDTDTNLSELKNSILVSKKHLEKLRRSKREKEKQKSLYEKQLRQERNKLISRNQTSRESIDKQKSSESKTLALFVYSSNTSNSTVSLNTEELQSLRHEIKNLRKMRDHLLQHSSKISLKLENKKNREVDERKLFEFEEAIEVIDFTIEWKTALLCGHQPCNHKIIEEINNKILMERLLKLNENEMRILLYLYIGKVIDLRCSSKRLELQILDVEKQKENLTCREQYLSHNLQQVQLQAERRIAILQQQHEEKLHRILKYITGIDRENDRVLGSKHTTIQVAGFSKQADKNLITRFAQYVRQEKVSKQLQGTKPAAPQATVIIGKKKIVMQQNN